jgi:hypothetical protein
MTRATSRAASRPAGVPPRGKTTFGGVSSSRRCGAPLFAPLVHGCPRVGGRPSQIEGRREEQPARCTGEDLLLRAQGDQLGERMSDGQQRGQKTKRANKTFYLPVGPTLFVIFVSNLYFINLCEKRPSKQLSSELETP